jgi:DNA-binding PadR family transcriptional regulator
MRGFFHRRGWDERFADALHAIRHHHGHGHGFGHFAGMFGDAGMGGRGFRTGRKLSSEGLQLLLLALLADRPSHGYELIKALEERSGGFYSPSPGMVYPALQYLEEVGHASVIVDGTKKLYSITAEGQQFLDERREIADATLSQLARVADRMGRVREAFGDDDDDERDGASSEVSQARRRLKRALRDKRHVSREEASRIVAILKRATAEILDEK